MARSRVVNRGKYREPLQKTLQNTLRINDRIIQSFLCMNITLRSFFKNQTLYGVTVSDRVSVGLLSLLVSLITIPGVSLSKLGEK